MFKINVPTEYFQFIQCIVLVWSWKVTFVYSNHYFYNYLLDRLFHNLLTYLKQLIRKYTAKTDTLSVHWACNETQQPGFVIQCFVWGDRSWPIRARLRDLLCRSAQDTKERERCLWLRARLPSSSITEGYCRSNLGSEQAWLRDMYSEQSGVFLGYTYAYWQ